MKVLFLTVGDRSVASTRSRVYGYLPYLEKKGIKYKILKFTSRGKIKRIIDLKKDKPVHFLAEILYKIYILTRLIILAPGFDVIFIQKVIIPKIALMAVKKSNNHIIFDFDDAIQADNDISYMLKEVPCVVVSNRYLADYASEFNNNTHELISPVDVDNKAASRDNKRLTVGWIGSPETSRYLYSIAPTLKKLKEKFKNLDIELMGVSRDPAFDSSGINVIDWSLEEQNNYLERLDIGIMPLDDTEGARSKAGYKLLVYMSKGIACVASPIGMNTEIIEDGKSGFFAGSPEEWMDKISALLDDKKLREDVAEKGRIRAKEHFSYTKLFPRFLNILHAVKNI